MVETAPAAVKAASAFARARRKALLRRVWKALRGQPDHLLPYEEVRRRIQAGLPTYRGMQTVPVAKIIGSVDRYRDFDRVFLPTQGHTADRWRRIGRAYYQEIILPPVTLYQIGEAYFVVDGNHRVSVARQLGQEFIDAEVLEVRSRVPLTPDMDPDDIEVIGDKANFLEVTRLDETRPDVSIELTVPGGYSTLLQHIEFHRYLQSQEWKRDFTTEEAAAQWLEQVYLPVVQVIRESGIMRDFPGHTEGDLYLWVIEHQYYMREQFGDRVSTWDAARHYAEHFTPRIFKRFWHFVRYHLLGRIGPGDHPPHD